MDTQDVRLPRDARFTCQSCGRCCQGWAVPVDQRTVDRLRKRDWGSDPFVATPGAAMPFRIRLVNDRCFFLDHMNRCRIHAELSYEDKPDACRSFPLAVLDVQGIRYARLSYWCPTVAANTGRPLAQQVRWINDSARHADRGSGPVSLSRGQPLSDQALNRFHRVLQELVSRTDAPLGDRLAAATAVVRRAVSRPSGEALSGAQGAGECGTEALHALAQETRLGGSPSGGRRVLALYLLQDTRGGRLALGTHFAAVSLFLAGVGRLSSRAVGARAAWRHVRVVPFTLSDGGSELLTRYFLSKLDSRRYVAGELSLLGGLNQLAAAYGIVNILTRLRAASERRHYCTDEDLRRGLGAADLLVMEHAARLEHGLHGRLVLQALEGGGLCGDILACVEKTQEGP